MAGAARMFLTSQQYINGWAGAIGKYEQDESSASDGSMNIAPHAPRSAPLSASFTQAIRPFLDTVDRLRSLGVSEEGITLPTIVVVGDQSAGKSSVLESLSGVQLPKGQGIVTRVPLVLRLQGSPSSQHLLPKITIAYMNTEEEISERDIPSALTAATEELAGTGKAIANKPITLNVCKPGAPNLTLVDLPGITRVPVQGQPDNIYQTIQDLIMHYIKPEETIILNVLSAAMDFSVCESIRMSREVDKLGTRTLAVVTKVDMCPDGLLQKITDDAVRIGLGYICVRNKTKREASFEEAEEAERALFASHSELKKLSKAMVGVHALANRLVMLQTQALAGVLPKVLLQIENSLDRKREELQQLSGDITNAADANVAFFRVSSSIKRSLQDVLLAGNDINPTAYADDAGKHDHQLHYTSSLHAEFEKFTYKITTECEAKVVSFESGGGYLDYIQRLLLECLGTNLPNLVPQAVIEKMVGKLVDSVSSICTSELPTFVHDAARKLAFSVVAKHAGQFPTLKKMCTAAFQKALSDCRVRCFNSITRRLEMEKAVVYTPNSQLYITLVNALMRATAPGSCFMANVEGLIKGLSMMYVRQTNKEATKQAACSVLAYWIFLSRRLADDITRELRFSANEALFNVMDEVVGEVVGQRLSMVEIMAEQPEVAHERLRLRTSIDILTKSKDLITRVLGDATCAH